MDRINDIVDSKFRFVLLAAERAEQMMRGARPKLPDAAGKTKVRTAMNEILEQQVQWDYGPAPAQEPAADTAGEDAASEAGEEGESAEGVN